MPIDYQVASDEGVLLARVPGRTTLQDLEQYVAATTAHPDYSPSLVEVVDLTALTEPAAAAAAFDAARLLAHVLPVRRVRARGLVAPTALLSELARHYQRETADTGVETRVFRDVRAARRWARRVAGPGPRPRRA